MDDFRQWRRRARAVIAGAFAMTLLWPCVALYRGTTGYDWYAAVKLTVTEAMIAVGFNSFEVTRYRAPDGTSSRIARGGLVVRGEVIDARERILYTALVGALHGGLAGALWVALWVIFWRAVKDWRILRVERLPDLGAPETIDTWNPAGMAEGPLAKVAGDGRIALWVLSESQAARLMEALGARKNPRAIPAQPYLERANTSLLPAADTAGAAADHAGTKVESADAKPKNTDAVANKRRAKAGDGGQPRASLDASDPDSEDGLSELDDGGNVNWL